MFENSDAGNFADVGEDGTWNGAGTGASDASISIFHSVERVT